MTRCIEADVCVVGAGAAGLWAAARVAAACAELGTRPRVVLLEKTARTGTKILASGGERCNLTTTLGPDAAAQLFGPVGERFLRRAFRELSPRDLRARFDELGVPSVEAPLEKVFPQSGRARDVRDALERDARARDVDIQLGCGVLGIRYEAQRWVAELADGAQAAAPLLLLAPGGASVPRSGTTGDGWAWLAGLDLPVVPARPALVPLRSPDAGVTELAGISVQDAELRLVDPAGRVLGRRRRPLLFTHTGLSGPAALDLSRPVARAEEPAGFEAFVDLLPDSSREELRQFLVELAGRSGAPRLRHALPEELPRRLFARVAEQAGCEQSDPRANELSKSSRHGLIEALKGLRVPLDGTLGLDKAEVTTGGLELRAVDAGTMRVRGRPGLYVFGELLDLDGPVGGLNFQAAFATAELAGTAAAREVVERG